MPALSLLAQIVQPLGHLRPADGVGGVADGIVDAVDCAVFVQLDHQLHILAHGLVVVAAHGDDRVLFEQSERAGNDERAVEAVKEDARGEEGAVILQHLHESEDAARQAVAFDAPVFQLHVIRDAHDAAHRHHLAVLQHRLGDAAQRVVLQHGVRVHADEVGKGRGVDAHVQRVCLAAVFLADERERHLLHARFVDTFLPPALDPAADGTVDNVHIERLGKHLGGRVARTVVHHDDLIGAVVERKQRAHRVHNGDLLVVGGHDDADGQIVVRGQDAFELLLPVPLIEVERADDDREEQKGRIADQIGDEEIAHDREKQLYAVIHTAASFPFSSSARISKR